MPPFSPSLKVVAKKFFCKISQSRSEFEISLLAQLEFDFDGGSKKEIVALKSSSSENLEDNSLKLLRSLVVTPIPKPAAVGKIGLSGGVTDGNPFCVVSALDSVCVSQLLPSFFAACLLVKRSVSHKSPSFLYMATLQREMPPF